MRSVEVGVDDEGGESAEHAEQCESSGRSGMYRADPEDDGEDGDGEDPGAGVLPADRENGDGRVNEQLVCGRAAMWNPEYRPPWPAVR